MEMKSISINNGLFLGIILIIFTIVLSYVNPRLFLQAKSFLLVIPFILILIKTGLDFRKLNGGIASLADLFVACFICSIIAILMCSSFEYLQFNYFNPGLLEIQYELSLEALEQSKSLFGEAYAEKGKSFLEKENLYGLKEIISMVFIRFFIPGAFFSFLVALILKRSNSITKS